jgi:hypothetical protein
MNWSKIEVPDKQKWKELLDDFERVNGFKYTRRPRYFVDENLGAGTTEFIRQLKANVTDVLEQNMSGKGDEHVWRFCQRERRILLSHDNDFMNENQYPIRKSFGYVVLPHKEGGERPLIQKLAHLVSVLSGGAGILYEKKLIIRENGHWELHSIGETGAIEKSLYDMNDRNHVYELENA